MATSAVSGRVASLWRFPVKSMQGEELAHAAVGAAGFEGDRTFALVDVAENRVVSAKNPRKWPGLFAYRAVREANGVRVTLPDGRTVTSHQPDRDALFSGALGRPVRLSDRPPTAPTLEEYWPDLEGLPHRDAVTDENMPAGSFFDLAPVHLLTTATLRRLSALYPEGRFEAARFRPNVFLEVDCDGFVEQEWIGKTVALGESVRLEITVPCPRCVMTTLAQGDLPADPGILRTAVRNCGGNVGVYARVVTGGEVKRGDALRVE